MNAFDLRDYSFIQNLSENLEKLAINADTMGGSIRFDCQWLLRYKNLYSLWLGKKARKNIDCLYQITALRSLSLRGIKLSSFAFLKKMNLEVLELLWNSNNNLDELSDLKSLKEISLWRINKLENVDFISELENIEVIKLRDLKHLKKLPDLSHLKKLEKIILENTKWEILKQKARAVSDDVFPLEFHHLVKCENENNMHLYIESRFGYNGGFSGKDKRDSSKFDKIYKDIHKYYG